MTDDERASFATGTKQAVYEVRRRWGLRGLVLASFAVTASIGGTSGLYGAAILVAAIGALESFGAKGFLRIFGTVASVVLACLLVIARGSEDVAFVVSVFAAYALFAFLVVSIAAGRAFDDAFAWRALTKLIRARDPEVVEAAGPIDASMSPRRLRELGIARGQYRRLAVVLGGNVLFALDGVPTRTFPRVPVTRVHVVERVPELLVELTRTERITSRTMSDGELEDLRRMRDRAMVRATAAATPVLFAIRESELISVALRAIGVRVGAGVVAVAILACVPVVAFVARSIAAARYRADLAARIVRRARPLDADRDSPPAREWLFPSGRTWSVRGVTSRDRWLPVE